MHSCLRLGKSPTYPWDSPSRVPGPAVAAAQKPCREASAQAPGGRESGVGVVLPALRVITGCLVSEDN